MFLELAARLYIDHRMSLQPPGTPLSACSPRSSNVIPDPTTRSLTVLDANTTPGGAIDEIRAPTTTASPPGLPSIISHSPVCTPARASSPSSETASMTADAQRNPRAGPSKLAKKPSPAVSISRPRKRTSSCLTSVVSLNQVAPARVSDLRCALRRIDDVGKEQRRQDTIRFARFPRSRPPRAGEKVTEQCKRLALVDGPDDGIRKRQLHEASARHPLGDVPACLDAGS